MSSFEIKKQPKKTITISIDFDWPEIEKEILVKYEQLNKDLKINGFKKGKAPIEIAKENIPFDKVSFQAVNEIAIKKYNEIIEKEGFAPMTQPIFRPKKFKENESYSIEIIIVEKPEINLEGYKDIAKEVKKELPNNPRKKSEDDYYDKMEDFENRLVEKMTEKIKFEISDVLISRETEERFKSIAYDAKELNISVESYMELKGLNEKELKEKYDREVELSIKFRLILEEIGILENIKIGEKEVNETFFLFDHIRKTMGNEKVNKPLFQEHLILLFKKKVILYLFNLDKEDADNKNN